jgi:hypothetical protein
MPSRAPNTTAINPGTARYGTGNGKTTMGKATSKISEVCLVLEESGAQDCQQSCCRVRVKRRFNSRPSSRSYRAGKPNSSRQHLLNQSRFRSESYDQHQTDISSPRAGMAQPLRKDSQGKSGVPFLGDELMPL